MRLTPAGVCDLETGAPAAYEARVETCSVSVLHLVDVQMIGRGVDIERYCNTRKHESQRENEIPSVTRIQGNCFGCPQKERSAGALSVGSEWNESHEASLRTIHIVSPAK